MAFDNTMLVFIYIKMKKKTQYIYIYIYIYIILLIVMKSYLVKMSSASIHIAQNTFEKNAFLKQIHFITSTGHKLL